MMKTIIRTFLALAGTVAISAATQLPGYDITECVIPKTTDAVIGVLISAIRTNEPGNSVLFVTVKAERILCGTLTNAVFEAKYREFTIPAIPEGMGVDFVNYTGSGVEWEAKTNTSYVFFLSHQTNTVSLLRLEPVGNEAKIKGLFEELKKKEPQPISAVGVLKAAPEK